MARKNKPRAFWCPVELLLVKRLYPAYALRDLPSFFADKSKEQIRSKIKYLSLTSRKALKTQSIAHNYFSQDSIESAYWAGFIAADGCVHNEWLLSVGISRSDRDHLVRLAECLGVPDDVRDVVSPGTRVINGVQYKTKGISRLSVPSTQIIQDLRRIYSITPRKSLTLKSPRIGEKCSRLAFLAGYIDGDGTICLDCHGHIRIYLIGTRPFLGWVKRLVDGYLVQAGLPASFPPLPYRESKYTYVYGVTGHKAECLVDHIFDLNLPVLKRKWKKLERYRPKR